MRKPFSDAEVSRLRADYRTYVDAGRLDELSVEMGRSKSVLCEKARTIGLTDAVAARKASAAASAEKCTGVPKWNERPHPKGMLGKTHTPETRAQLSMTSAAFRASLSTERSAAINLKALRTTVERHGKLAPAVSRGTWKAGWREIGGKRNFYRSRWEANYARYLQWLKDRSEIRDWEHEPETFWFEAIRRGVRSYLPDFRVWENSGASALHEVKGWMDSRSRTTLSRMAKYHPDQRILVIAEREYSAIARTAGILIPDWEQGERTGRW